MYKDIPETLLRVVEPVVRDHGLELVAAPLAGGARLRVIVDTPAGDGRVDIEACARLSRELGHALDAIGPRSESYQLEVSSPGLDRTLGRPVDFERAVGRRVQVVTRAPLEGRRRFKGELLAFAASCARIQTDSGPVEVPFAQIARARALDLGSPGRGR